MHGKANMYWWIAVTLAGFTSCSSEPTANKSEQAAPALHQIHGKAEVLPASTSADAALNAGGSSVYLWDGMRRYRLFLKSPVEVVNDKEYVVEGVHAQNLIDEIGDPSNGKNGYPLEASCRKAVRMAWTGLSIEATALHVSSLRAIVKRYPARPVFLLTKLTPKESKADSAEKKKDIAEVSVAAEKQKAFLLEGPAAQTAPLWEPAGGTVRCKVIIDTDGKISKLDSGTQLCEAAQWEKFRYQPPVQGGHPVRVKTEVELSFEPRK